MHFFCLVLVGFNFLWIFGGFVLWNFFAFIEIGFVGVFFGEEGAGGWGVVSSLFLQGLELFDDAVEHGLQAVFGFGEAVEGVGFGIGFESVGQGHGGREEDGGFFAGIFLVRFFDGGFEVAECVEVEAGVGLGEAVESPGEADGAFGEEEFRAGLG